MYNKINKIILNIDIKILDLLTILIVGSFLQIAYLFSIPLGFECDAGMFYSYAKGLILLNGGVISTFRPLIYPTFLLFTGFIFPGTFIITVFVQGVFGIIIPLIVYKILIKNGRIFALLGSFLIILSCISFVGAKLILAEQLYAFILIFSVLYFVKYIDDGGSNNLYIYIILTLLATLTRLEGQVPSACGISILLWVTYCKTRSIKNVLLGLALVTCILGGYSFIRAVYLHDLNQFGSLQTGTGAQFYNRFYGGFGAEEFNAKRNILTDKDILGEIDAQLISVENGPATKEFREKLGVAIIKYPEIYQGMKDGLSKLIVEKDAPGDSYGELFGRFESNPQGLLDNIFHSDRNLRTIQYTFYAPEALSRLLGRKKADRLLLSVALEAVLAHPKILYSLIPQAFTLIGINLMPIITFSGQNSNIEDLFPSVFFNPGVFDYARTGFNAGSCAKDLLPSRMWQEYEKDLSITSTKFSDTMIDFATIGRNYVRAICGFTILLLSPFIFYHKRRSLNIFLFSSVFLLVVVIGLSVSGGGSKYDIPFMPLLILLAVSLLSNFMDFLKQFWRTDGR